MIEKDADAVREVHILESGPWRLVPIGSHMYLTRADHPKYRSRNFATIAECRAYISGFVDCEVTAARPTTPDEDTPHGGKHGGSVE